MYNDDLNAYHAIIYVIFGVVHISGQLKGQGIVRIHLFT